MVDDELPPDAGDDSALPPGPRRSTFTPPPGGVNYEPTVTDDDELANALAQQLPQASPPPQFAPPTPVYEPLPEMPTVDAGPTLPPGPAVDAGPMIPPPPQRQSLSDSALLAAADLDASDLDTSSLLDLVERELQLRTEEAARLAEWEQQVREAAVPDAEQIVSEVRSQFTGVIPVVVPPAAVLPAVEPPPVEPPPAAMPVEPPPAAMPVDPPPAAMPVPEGPTGFDLDLALADAPPPLGIAVTAVPPPGSVPAPPELVEPGLPDGTAPVVSAPTAFEALLAAADAPTGETAALASDTPEPEQPWRMEAIDEAEWADDGVDAPIADEVDESEPVEPVAVARAPRVERTGLESTVAEYRTGRSIRMFWLWFAVNASVVSLGLGGVLLGLGMSLRQSILATLIGVAVSFLPLGLGTLASKWSGQPTMVVSRATFGMVGNGIPALLAVVTRLVWAGALLWILGIGVAEVLIGGSVVTGIARLDLGLAVAGGALVIAAVIAGIGFRAVAVLSAIVTILGLVLIGGVIALTVSYVDVSAALSVADGPWLLLASGAILVFSVVGLAWANSSGDVARYQVKGSAGSAAVLFTAFGATIPTFVLISWGALLAASNPFVAEGLVENPVDIVARMLPLWYPVPLVLAVALGLLAAATLALYSGGFALLAVGIRTSRQVAVVIAVVLAALATVGLAFFVADVTDLFRDVVTTLAVPVAAWAGIFGAETMIRNRRVHSPSLLARGGVYPAVRWVNTVMLLVITAIGWGLTTATVTGLQWQGYAWPLLGVSLDDPLATADLGVAIALVLGLLTPIVAGIPALRKLQAAERAAAQLEGTETMTTDIPVAAEARPAPAEAQPVIEGRWSPPPPPSSAP